MVLFERSVIKMKPATFKLEKYIEQYKNKAPYSLCSSDAETWHLKDILNMASVEEKHLWENLNFKYTQSKGLLALRERIASSFYPGFNAENVVCFAGAEEGIFCTLFTRCDSTDHVIVITPCYQSLLETIKFKGSSITEISLKEENEWRLDLSAVEAAIRPHTKWFIINFPHNPTGQILRPKELEALVDLLDKHGIWLFSDEISRLIGPKTTVWSKPAACLYPKALSLGGMSKIFGMAGLRIGWIACQSYEILQDLEDVKQYTSMCNSGLSEIISLIAIRNKEVIIEHNNTIIEGNLFELDLFFEEFADYFSWVRPQGGCIGFVKYNVFEPVSTFTHRLAEQHGILLIPAPVYNFSSNHFRIGFGKKNMREILQKLKNSL